MAVLKNIPVLTGPAVMYQGDALSLFFTVKDSTGADIDLSGLAGGNLEFSITPANGGAPVIATKQIGSGIQVLGAVANNLEVDISAGDIKVPGQYVYAVRYVAGLANTNAAVIATDTLTVKPSPIAT